MVVSHEPHALAFRKGEGPPMAPRRWKWVTGKRAKDICFVSPDGVRIRSKVALFKFLATYPNSPAKHEFLWRVEPSDFKNIPLPGIEKKSCTRRNIKNLSKETQKQRTTQNRKSKVEITSSYCNTGNEDNQGGETQRFGEENVEEEMGREKGLGKEDEKGTEIPREKEEDDPSLGISLSFLNTAKIKADSSLRGDSWTYNEIMKLKKKLGKVQKDQENDRAKIVLLETQVGNILEKLKEYEQSLRHMIKESGNTSSLCAAVASLGKKTNKDIISPRGPSKRTRLSLRKKAAEVTAGIGFSPADTTLSATDVGKEAAKMIKELQ